MRTLDEVIKAWSICFSDNSRSNCTGCPYADEDGESACFNHDREDAFHYLKEFKRISVRLEKIALGNIMETLEKLDNPALTWDELKQMKGKPVWIEDTYCKFYGWEIVERLGTNKWMTGEFLETNGGLYRKENQGESWQAYRKERS